MSGSIIARYSFFQESRVISRIKYVFGRGSERQNYIVTTCATKLCQSRYQFVQWIYVITKISNFIFSLFKKEPTRLELNNLHFELLSVSWDLTLYCDSINICVCASANERNSTRTTYWPINQKTQEINAYFFWS